MKKIIVKSIISFLGACLLIFIIFLIFIYFFQDKFIFFPSFSEESYNELSNNSSFEEINIKSNSLTLNGWIYYDNIEKTLPLIIYFGGNAQNSSKTFNYFLENNIFDYFKGYNVMYIDYPGYGKSEGTPDTKLMLESSIDIYEYTLTLDNIDQDNIIIIGYSLGTGIATYLASVKDVNGLILVAPYGDLLNMYNDRLNIFHGILKKLVKYRINSKEYAEKVNVSPLIFTSYDDNVINYEHTTNLAKYFNSYDDLIILDNNTNHNDYFNQEIVLDNIYDYLQERI